MKEIKLLAVDENLYKVLDFIKEQLADYEYPEDKVTMLSIAVEEIFVNISHYAYNPEVGPATIQVEVDESPLSVTITFFDNGIPYDPLLKCDPDITLDADERAIGGLGIYMVKQSMDDMCYEYKDGQNVLTIKKLL